MSAIWLRRWAVLIITGSCCGLRGVAVVVSFFRHSGEWQSLVSFLRKAAGGALLFCEQESTISEWLVKRNDMSFIVSRCIIGFHLICFLEFRGIRIWMNFTLQQFEISSRALPFLYFLGVEGD